MRWNKVQKNSQHSQKRRRDGGWGGLPKDIGIRIGEKAALNACREIFLKDAEDFRCFCYAQAANSRQEGGE